MNNHYRKPKLEEKQEAESPKIDLGREFPEEKDVKLQKREMCKRGNHGPA